MKHTRKCLTTAFMILICLFAFTGCGQKKVTAYQSYVKNLLDVNYKGDYTNYVKQNKGNETDALALYQDCLSNLANQLITHYNLNTNQSVEVNQTFTTVAAAIYNDARYEVSESYKENGTVCGITLPEGLKESDKLPEPIYTPSTKAEIGDHDENISFEQSVDHLEKYYPGRGRELAEKLRDNTIALYKKCAEYALSKGIIIADTKFEFGLDENGNMVIGDEMLTPDSSRFWPADGYEAGHGQPSFDKQFARDWLKANPDNAWTLPQEIVDKTIEKYLQAYKMLTGKDLEK